MVMCYDDDDDDDDVDADVLNVLNVEDEEEDEETEGEAADGTRKTKTPHGNVRKYQGRKNQKLHLILRSFGVRSRTYLEGRRA